MKNYMFRAVPLPIIRSLFTVHSALVYIIYVWRQLSSRTRMELIHSSWSCSKAVFKLVWHIPMPSVQWINSWWQAEELPETCRVSCRSKFGKSMHLVGFVKKKRLIWRRKPGLWNASQVIDMSKLFVQHTCLVACNHITFATIPRHKI